MISIPHDIYGLTLFELFVAELGAARVSTMLDVHPDTLRRWLRGATPVPKMAVMALFWETKYGKSLINSDQVNEIRLLYRRVCMLQEQFRKAADVVAGLRRLHAGTANEPFFDDMQAFADFPLDTYGPGPGAAFSTHQSREEEAPARNPAPVRSPSSAAKAAMASFDELRQIAAG